MEVEIVLYHPSIGKEKYYRHAFSEKQARFIAANAFKKKHRVSFAEVVSSRVTKKAS